MLHKLATTVRGLIGTDWVRITLADVESVGIAWVRADGSNAVVPVLPTVYRTDSDLSNVAAKLGHKVDYAAVPKVGLQNHVWKGQMTLAELAEHPYQGKALKSVMDRLIATYTEDEAEAAA